MEVKYKEDKWNLGISADPFIGYKGQYQYAKNIDIRSLKNGICLSSRVHSTSNVGEFNTYTKNNGIDFIRAEDPQLGTSNDTPVYLVDRDTQSKDLIGNLQYNNPFHSTSFMTMFHNKVWAGSGGSHIFVFDPIAGQGAISAIANPTWTDENGDVHYLGSITTVLNYSNTMLLFGGGNEIWRYVPIAQPGLPIGWKRIRKFEDGVSIFKLTMEGNYLKIYVNGRNGDVKIHYAKGTFDVEDAGLVQTITIKNRILKDIVSNGVTDFALLQDFGNLDNYYLYEMRGYDKRLIMKTRKSNTGMGIIDMFNGGQKLAEYNGTIYAYMGDGLWSFKKEGSIRSGSIQRDIPGKQNASLFVDGEMIYASGEGREYRASIEDFVTGEFQGSGYLIGRIYKGGDMSVGKENIKLTLGYLLENGGGDIRVFVRYDRDDTGLGSFHLIKTIDDIERMYDEVFPTTIDHFRRSWNVMEYKIELRRGDADKTPRFYEFNLAHGFIRRIKK